MKRVVNGFFITTTPNGVQLKRFKAQNHDKIQSPLGLESYDNLPFPRVAYGAIYIDLFPGSFKISGELVVFNFLIREVCRYFNPHIINDK